MMCINHTVTAPVSAILQVRGRERLPTPASQVRTGISERR